MTTTANEKDTKAEVKRFEAIWWGGALVWIGIALAADYMDILPRIDGDWWPWIFIGIGPWALILNTYQAASPTAPNPTTWDWIWTVVFMAVAVSSVLDLTGAIVGALTLIVIGVVVLTRAVLDQER